MSGCGADILANELLDSLTTGIVFEIPTVDLNGTEFDFPGGEDSDLYKEVTKLTNEDLTTREVGGSGTFDALMASNKAHLQEEFEANRITGEQYVKAYIELTGGAMSAAVQFLLGREQTYWNAVTAQIQAITARATLEIEKIRVAQAELEANTIKVNYAKTKISLATEDKNFCAASFNLDNILPAQHTLLLEQGEAQRAQTMDVRSDGVTPVVGSIGKQKELYDQQITSYQRNDEIKAGKIWSDSWITQKTIDEGLQAPAQFTNAEIDEVLTAIKVNNNLGS